MIHFYMHIVSTKIIQLTDHLSNSLTAFESCVKEHRSSDEVRDEYLKSVQ